MTRLAEGNVAHEPEEVASAAHAVAVPVAPLRRAPRGDAPLDTEALMGERVAVLGPDEEGWVRARLETDGYHGYLPADALALAGPVPTHRVRALRTFRYPGPDLKLPVLDALSFGATVAVVSREGDYARLAEGGFVHEAHLEPVAARAPDFVATAERFLEVPYLWGGRTGLGLDCSALVQLSLASAGTAAPRDSGPQEATLGTALPDGAALRRGDLVFWRGHVGIMLDATRLLHANGHHMAVAAEDLAGARARILAAGAGPVTSIRRLS